MYSKGPTAPLAFTESKIEKKSKGTLQFHIQGECKSMFNITTVIIQIKIIRTRIFLNKCLVPIELCNKRFNLLLQQIGKSGNTDTHKLTFKYQGRFTLYYFSVATCPSPC